MDPNPIKIFNDILTARTAFERSEYGSYGIPQFRESIQMVLVAPALLERAAAVGAAALLTYAYDAHVAQGRADLEGAPSSPEYLAVSPAVDTLFATRPAIGSDADLQRRLTTFVASARAAIEELNRPAQPSDDPPVGIITSSGGVDIDAKILGGDYPQVALLAAQTAAMNPLIKLLGRQQGSEPWGEWIKHKAATVIEGLPGVIEWASWTVASKAISRVLGVGMIPIMGFNVVTFGAQVLAPWSSLREFPRMMSQQAVLYDLQTYARRQMRLSDDDPVVKVLRDATATIDWAAVKCAFRVTPVGILISVHSGVKTVAKYVVPEKFTTYGWAKVLIDAADASLTRKTPSNRLAAMAVMFLAGDEESYLELMTLEVGKAYGELAKKFID